MMRCTELVTVRIADGQPEDAFKEPCDRRVKVCFTTERPLTVNCGGSHEDRHC
jgi:hypothetical protein